MPGCCLLMLAWAPAGLETADGPDVGRRAQRAIAGTVDADLMCRPKQSAAVLYIVLVRISSCV